MHHPGDYRALAEHAAQAVASHRADGDERALAKDLVRLGNLAVNLADYVIAIDCLHEAQDLAQRLADAQLERSALGHLEHALSELGDLEAALECNSTALRLAESSGDPEAIMLAINSRGCTLGALGRHDEALHWLARAHDLIPSITTASEDRRRHYLSQSFADQSRALLDAGRAQDALEAAREGRRIAEHAGIETLMQLNDRYAARALLALHDVSASLALFDRALEITRRLHLPTQEARLQAERAEALALSGRHREAYAATREAQAIERAFRRDEAARRVGFRKARGEIEAARREAQIAERVLSTVLPESIGRRMKAGESRIAEEIADVSVLFTDVVGFTALTRRVPPHALIAQLDAMFSSFDAIVAEFGLVKIKTIGDAYMAVGGALSASEDHLERCVCAALAMLAEVERHNGETGATLTVRVGVHAGPAIAGVIGRERLSYDLWGETVNTASRLESTGQPAKVHVSQAVVDRLGARFEFERRGVTELKGIGPMQTYFVIV